MRVVLHLLFTIIFADVLYLFVLMSTGGTLFAWVVAGATGFLCGVLSARLLGRMS